MGDWKHRVGVTAIASLSLGGHIPPTLATSFGLHQPATVESAPQRMSQLFYPPANAQKIIRVIGQGTARQAAEVAEVQILVDIQESYDDSPPFEEEPPSEPTFELPSTRETFQPAPASLPTLPIRLAQSDVSEEDLAPLVDALVQSGISRDKISTKVPKSRPQLSPFPFPSLGKPSAPSVSVKVQNPTPERIEGVIIAAENHLNNSKRLSLNDIKVSYRINQCEQLKLQAFENAVIDAKKRAKAIADAMQATLSPAASAAEPFFNMFVPGCESGKEFSLSGKKNSYEPGDPIEVVVSRIIFFTYTIE